MELRSLYFACLFAEVVLAFSGYSIIIKSLESTVAEEKICSYWCTMFWGITCIGLLLNVHMNLQPLNNILYFFNFNKHYRFSRKQKID